MKVKFKTVSDTNCLFMIKGRDLNQSQKNLTEWKIDFDASIAGPRRTIIKKKGTQIEIAFFPLVGKMPKDVTGKVRVLPAEDEWVGVSISGTSDLILENLELLEDVDAYPIYLKIGKERFKLSGDTPFDWAMEGRLAFTLSD